MSHQTDDEHDGAASFAAVGTGTRTAQVPPDDGALRLVLVRHGRTPSNVRHRLDTALPGPGLDELGHAQAEEVAGLLAGSGATAARFFINGLASTTKGIDAVAHYRVRTVAAGNFDLTVAGNINDGKVTRVPTSTSTLDPAPTLFARSRILTLEDGTPGEKVTGSIDWSLDQLGALARVTYYGDVNQPGTTPAADVHSGKHVITDVELRYQATKGAQLGLGVSNLFDVYPRQVPPNLNTTGAGPFSSFSPFGFNGRFVYGRMSVRW